MKTTTGQKLKIGLFTVIGIVILLVAIFLIGSQKNLFSSTYSVYGVFKNVGGLQLGNNVRLAGINVGVVQDITLITDTSVKVTLTLNKDAQKFVKTDAKLAIGTDGFIGDKLVTIAPGGATTTQIAQAGQELKTIPPLDMDKMIARFTKIADNAGSMTEDLAAIVHKVNSGQGSIGRLLNNDNIAKSLEKTVKSANTTLSSVNASVAKSTGTLNEDLKAAQNNFLLKGYFKKKEKAKQAKKDSINKSKGITDTTTKKKRKILGIKF